MSERIMSGVRGDRREFLRACVGAALLAGCERSAARVGGPVTLSFWTLALRPMFDGYIKGQIALFEAANPGVKVDWVDVPYDALERKLIAAAAAGRAPDVVNMADLNFARFVSLGAFREIGPDLPGDAQKQYLPGALSLCVIHGQTLAVPWYVNPQALLVNTRLLAKGGLTVETVSPTWSGLVEQAREFHTRTGAYLFSQPLGEESQLPIMILGEGLDPLKASASGGLESNMASPEMERYLGQFVSLYRDGGLPREAATKGHAHLTEMFQDGRVAAISTGPNFLKRIKDVAPGVFKDTVVLPGAVGALGRVHLPVMILAVTTQSKHPAQAAKLAWAMTGPEAQTEFCKHAAIMPSSTESLNDPFFEGKGDSETDPKLLSARRVAAQTLREAVAFTASLETWPDLRRAFEDEFKRVLLGERDLKPALLEIDRLWRGILAAAPRATIDAIPRPSVVAPPARRFQAPSA